MTRFRSLPAMFLTYVTALILLALSSCVIPDGEHPEGDNPATHARDWQPPRTDDTLPACIDIGCPGYWCQTYDTVGPDHGYERCKCPDPASPNGANELMCVREAP